MLFRQGLLEVQQRRGKEALHTQDTLEKQAELNHFLDRYEQALSSREKDKNRYHASNPPNFERLRAYVRTDHLMN